MAISAVIKNTPVHVGDLIRVHQKIVEGDKERTQVFEGLIIKIRGRGENKTYTVRKIAAGGIGVEKIFPLESPWITRIEIKKPHTHVRRAKLYYVRSKSTRQVAKITQAQA